MRGKRILHEGHEEHEGKIKVMQWSRLQHKNGRTYEMSVVKEILSGIKRDGADMIITYHAAILQVF